MNVCYDDNAKCLAECEFDSNCISSCNRQVEKCIAVCPFQSECPQDWVSKISYLKFRFWTIEFINDRLYSSLDPFYRLRLVSKHDLSMCRKRGIRPMANVHRGEWYRSWALSERLRHWGYCLPVRVRRWLLSRPKSMSVWGKNDQVHELFMKIYVQFSHSHWLY